MRKKELSIVIPCYNEQDKIEYAVEHTISTMQDWKLQIVISDDGSTDDTAKLMITLVERYPDIVTITGFQQNIGKGRAVYNGLLLCRYQRRLIIDADLSIQPSELNKMILPKNKHYILKGQRIQVIWQPLYRILLGKSWQALVWLMTGINMDTQAPFTLLNLPGKFYMESSFKIDGFAFDVELLSLAKSKGYDIIKIPVAYYNDKNSKVTPGKVLEMFKDLLRLLKVGNR